MKTPGYSLAIALILSLLLLPPNILAQAQTKPPPNSIAITGVTVIDATGAPPKPDMTVVIVGDRIAEIGKLGRLRIPEGAQVVRAEGKFLIPGLWDMHTHIWDKDMLFPVYIANGITGVRDMGGVLEPWVKWRSQVAAGEMLGPRAVIGGKIVDGFKPFFYFFVQAASPEQGRETVRSLKGKGADFIKVYERLQKEVYFAIADETRRQNLSLAGHVPVEVKASEASGAGQKSIGHLTGVALECSSEEARLRAEAVSALNDARKDGLKVQDVSAAIRRSYDLSRYAPLDTYSEEKARQIFKLFRRNRTWHVPTLVVREEFGDEGSRLAIAAQLKYFPAFVRGMVLPESQAAEGERAKNRRHFQKELGIVRAMHGAGVRLLAGSDAPNPYSAPGFGLHDELALLVAAGLSPMEALQAATRNAAEFLGQLDSLGTVERGKSADLVLLEANPLADINNTRKIAAVIMKGQVLTKLQLQELLDNLEARVNKK